MKNSLVELAGLPPREMETILSPLIQENFSLAPFQCRQIFHWISQGAQSFEQMTNIPLALRNILAEKAVLWTSRAAKTVRAPDGTVKLQIMFDLGRGALGETAIEAVILTDAAGRKTACLSSQAGCALGCAFCQTGKLGFKRDLSAAEIVEQFFLLEKTVRGLTDRSGDTPQRNNDACTPPHDDANPQSQTRLSNIVFMGMGEPLLNLESVRKAIAVLTHKDGKALSMRRITISTAGIVPGIYDLANNGPHARLAVSLTACGDELRSRLMPGLNQYPLAELKKAILYWTEKTGKRCTLEAALFASVNTGKTEMKSLAAFARDVGAHVNLIPWNPVDGLPFSRPKNDECKKALAFLKAEGINATLRMSRGGAVAGACGQLGAGTG